MTQKAPDSETCRITINTHALLDFYDANPPTGKAHATTMNQLFGEDLGEALLVDYLRKSKKYGEAEVLSGPCKPPSGGGRKWLDRWVKAVMEGKDILFQVEIKMLSAHSASGAAKKLPIDATDEMILDYKKKRWELLWDSEQKQFGDGSWDKVFRNKMDSPAKFKHLSIEPLLCVWLSVHPDGAPGPMFDVPITSNYFDKLWIFSMSSYLRSLEEKMIELRLPNTLERLRWLKRILPYGFGDEKDI